MSVGRLNDLPIIMCVCRRGSGRSQMAAAYLRDYLRDRARVMAAGIEAADAIDPVVATVMREDGHDLSHARPMQVHPMTIAAADYVIIMGVDVQGVSRTDEDWDLPKPEGESTERVREIRDQIKSKARNLADRFIPLTPMKEVRYAHALGKTESRAVCRRSRTRARSV